MKTFLLIFIFALSLKADTVYLGNCISSFYIKTNAPTKLIYMTYSASGSETSVTYSDAILTQLVSNLDKFEYSVVALPTTTAKCSPKTTNYNYLGLTEENFNISMAFYGIFLSSLIAYGLIKAF